MAKELAKSYNPKDFEDRIYSAWNDKGCFRAEVDPKKTPYTIVIPLTFLGTAFFMLWKCHICGASVFPGVWSVIATAFMPFSAAHAAISETVENP